VNDSLFVNPKGQGTKNVKPKLECVDTLINHPSHFGYVAHFSYNNPNSSPVFVFRGPENSLVAEGNYLGMQPQLFMPGTHFFDIYFDGKKMVWTLITYNGNQKPSAVSQASSTSGKCPVGFVSNATIVMKSAGKPENMAAPNLSTGIYPNPGSNQVTLNTGDITAGVQSIFFYDISGRQYQPRKITRMNSSNYRLDLSNLAPGTYIINVRSGAGNKVFKFMKK
jgi:hypothetical protein